MKPLYWRPRYFPSVQLSISNVGSDVAVITSATLRILKISELPDNQRYSVEHPKGRDLAWAIIVDPSNGIRDYPVGKLFFHLEPGASLEFSCTIGVTSSARLQLAILFSYDNQQSIQSESVAIDVVNENGIERWYRHGARIYSFPSRFSKRAISGELDQPEATLEWLYSENRPPNLSLSVGQGPGDAFFFPDTAPLALQSSSGEVFRFGHASKPALFLAVVPVYGIIDLSPQDAMALADKGNLRVLTSTTGLETELSSNSLGACRFARSSAGVALTQLLVSGALWGINTELFEGETAESYIGEPHREGIDMIPWEAVAAACSETLEEYYSFLKYHLELHGPLAVKMGVINVEGQYVAYVSCGFSGVTIQGPIRKSQFTFGTVVDDFESIVGNLPLSYYLSHQVFEHTRSVGSMGQIDGGPYKNSIER